MLVFLWYLCKIFFAGWEYTLDASYGSTDYEAAEKTFHFSRRRRWIRERKIVHHGKDTVDGGVSLTEVFYSHSQ